MRYTAHRGARIPSADRTGAAATAATHHIAAGGRRTAQWASENATRIAVYFALIGIVITAGPVLMTPRLPPAEAWPALIMLGVFSTAAHILFARGCLIAPPDRVSILNYTSVFFAAALAWLLWDERVDWFMAAGTALIIAASFIAVRAGGNGSRNNPRQHTRPGGIAAHLGADK